MIKAIKTKTDYNKAFHHVYELIQKDLKARSDETNEIEVLSVLV